MNRKGDVGTEPIIVLTIAIAVLAIVGFGFYLNYSGQIQFFNLLPGFNQTSSEKNYIEIISYDLSSDKLEYYDGTNWIDFNSVSKVGKVAVGRKTLDVESTRKGYFAYWYDKNNREEIFVERLSDSDFEILYPLDKYSRGAVKSWSILGFWFIQEVEDNSRIFPPIDAQVFYISAKDVNPTYSSEIVSSSEGNLFIYSYYKVAGIVIPSWFSEYDVAQNHNSGSEVTVALLNPSNPSENIYGFIILDMSNNLRFLPIDLRSVSDNGDNIQDRTKWRILNDDQKQVHQYIDRNLSKLEILPKLINWRDSVLAKPMALDGKYYCVKKIDSRLIVDLNLEVKKESKCNA